jgi:hypothetical protein
LNCGSVGWCLVPLEDAMGPTLQDSGLVLEHQTFRLKGKNQPLELGSPGIQPGSVPPSLVHRLSILRPLSTFLILGSKAWGSERDRG